MTGVMAQFQALRPAGGYRVILADPPWSFETFSNKGHAKSPHAHYDCMDLDAIKALPVEVLAARDCLLFMWGVFPMVPHALEAMKSWGFTFKTGGAWHKKTVHGKSAFGTGYILRSACEPFFIGTRGAPSTQDRSTRNIIEAQVREHSRKPDVVYEMLERMLPDSQRIELFARQQREGWDAWGNEVAP